MYIEFIFKKLFCLYCEVWTINDFLKEQDPTKGANYLKLIVTEQLTIIVIYVLS